jgi:hypothetical protein
MSEERLSELRELLFNLERRIKPLEWDAGRNQINEYKKVELGKLKTQHDVFLKEFEDLEKK